MAVAGLHTREVLGVAGLHAGEVKRRSSASYRSGKDVAGLHADGVLGVAGLHREVR